MTFSPTYDKHVNSSWIPSHLVLGEKKNAIDTFLIVHYLDFFPEKVKDKNNFNVPPNTQVFLTLFSACSYDSYV